MKNTPETFWAKVDIRSEAECWPWTGSVNTWGYGDCYYQGERTNASRIAYRLSCKVVPEGLVVCHSCDNPICCNPAHLWVGTQADNLADCRTKGRQKYKLGPEHHRSAAKLTPKEVASAKRRYQRGETQTSIAKSLGVHSSTVSRAVRGEYWSEVP